MKFCYKNAHKMSFGDWFSPFKSVKMKTINNTWYGVWGKDCPCVSLM